MKRMKNIVYVIGVILALGGLILLSTAILQIGMEIIAHSMGIVIPETVLYHVSGGMGTAVTGVLFAVYVKGKKYTGSIEERQPFHIRTCAYYGALAFSICSVLFYAITTWVFAYVLGLTEKPNILLGETGESILLVDVLFSVVVAPIAEELLFRMGVYQLLGRRLKKGSAIILCTLIFALLHGYALQGFCMCLVGGLLFLLIYVRTGNIWYSIVAHMICNLDAYILNTLEDRGVTLWGIPVQYEVNGFNMVHPVLIVIAGIFCGVCIFRAKKKQQERKNSVKLKETAVRSA